MFCKQQPIVNDVSYKKCVTIKQSDFKLCAQRTLEIILRLVVDWHLSSDFVVMPKNYIHVEPGAKRCPVPGELKDFSSEDEKTILIYIPFKDQKSADNTRQQLQCLSNKNWYLPTACLI